MIRISLVISNNNISSSSS